MENVFKQVERNIDHLAEVDVNWSHPATKEQLQDARAGKLALPFSPSSTIPVEWLGDLRGKKVLCLAGAGGL